MAEWAWWAVAGVVLGYVALILTRGWLRGTLDRAGLIWCWRCREWVYAIGPTATRRRPAYCSECLRPIRYPTGSEVDR